MTIRRKQFSLVDHFGGAAGQQFTGTNIEVEHGFVILFDVYTEEEKFVGDFQKSYVKGIINLEKGFSVIETKEVHVGISST